jgi:hypothetical protein
MSNNNVRYSDVSPEDVSHFDFLNLFGVRLLTTVHVLCKISLARHDDDVEPVTFITVENVLYLLNDIFIDETKFN